MSRHLGIGKCLIILENGMHCSDVTSDIKMLLANFVTSLYTYRAGPESNLVSLACGSLNF